MTPLFPSYRDFQRLDSKVDLAITLLRLSLKLETHMSKDFDNLAAEVASDEAVMSGALTVIDALAVKIAEAGTDPQKLQQLTSGLMESRQALAAAIAANTPAHDETTAPPVVIPTVATLSPVSGAATGGDTVVITGTGFTGATGVTIGGASAAYNIDSDTQITATTPAGTVGAAPVVVTGPTGPSVDPVTFTYA